MHTIWNYFLYNYIHLQFPFLCWAVYNTFWLIFVCRDTCSSMDSGRTVEAPWCQLRTPRPFFLVGRLLSLAQVCCHFFPFITWFISITIKLMSHLGTLRRSFGWGWRWVLCWVHWYFYWQGQGCSSLEGTICFRCLKLRGTCPSLHLIVLYACILQGGAKDVTSATFHNTSRSPKFNYAILIIWLCCIKAKQYLADSSVESYVFFIGTFAILDVIYDILINWYKFWLILISLKSGISLGSILFEPWFCIKMMKKLLGQIWWATYFMVGSK
jgi:hypothetical protein